MTRKQATKKVVIGWNKILQSHYWKVIITGLICWFGAQFWTWMKDDMRVKDEVKKIPVIEKQVDWLLKNAISHDSTEVIHRLKEELYKDSARKQYEEVIKLLKEIKKDQGVIKEIVEVRRLKREMDSVPILIISDPPSAEIQEPVYSKTLQERYPYATKWIMDSLLAGKK